MTSIARLRGVDVVGFDRHRACRTAAARRSTPGRCTGISLPSTAKCRACCGAGSSAPCDTVQSVAATWSKVGIGPLNGLAAKSARPSLKICGWSARRSAASSRRCAIPDRRSSARHRRASRCSSVRLNAAPSRGPQLFVSFFRPRLQERLAVSTSSAKTPVLEVVAHAEVEGEPRADLPVVLDPRRHAAAAAPAPACRRRRACSCGRSARAPPRFHVETSFQTGKSDSMLAGIGPPGRVVDAHAADAEEHRVLLVEGLAADLQVVAAGLVVRRASGCRGPSRCSAARPRARRCGPADRVAAQVDDRRAVASGPDTDGRGQATIES